MLTDPTANAPCMAYLEVWFNNIIACWIQFQKIQIPGPYKNIQNLTKLDGKKRWNKKNSNLFRIQIRRRVTRPSGKPRYQEYASVEAIASVDIKLQVSEEGSIKT